MYDLQQGSLIVTRCFLFGSQLANEGNQALHSPYISMYTDQCCALTSAVNLPTLICIWVLTRCFLFCSQLANEGNQALHSLYISMYTDQCTTLISVVHWLV